MTCSACKMEAAFIWEEETKTEEFTRPMVMEISYQLGMKQVGFKKVLKKLIIRKSHHLWKQLYLWKKLEDSTDSNNN